MAGNTMVNGKEYDFTSVKVVIFNRVVEGINKITYGHTQEKTNNIGRGGNVVSRTHGKKEATCTIGLAHKEILLIRAAAKQAGYKSITDIPPFSVIVSYGNDVQILPVVTDEIRFCEFKSDTTNFDITATDNYQDYELVVGDIEYNK